MSPKIHFSALIFSATALAIVGGFNLSPHANQVFNIPQDQRIFMEQVRSSYFGFAVTLRTDGVMISAPRAQTTMERQRHLNETGAIYKCTFGDPDTPSTCAPFVFDALGDVEAPARDSMFQSRKKSQQWLGMAMDGRSSPSDKFVVCAPKMITPSTEHYLLHGMCYVSRGGTEGDKPGPLVEISPLRQTNQQVHTVGGVQKLMFMYGELGLSVHVTENNEEILIGAPGVYQWKGTVVRYRPAGDIDDGGLSKRDLKLSRTARQQDEVVEYTTDVPSPHLWNQSDDSYFGFAVTSGYFAGPEAKMLYAGSAPQAQPAGEVYVFDFVNHELINTKIIKKLVILTGGQMGEYFGYSLLADDFNKDGFTDLVVGAPSHSFDGYHEQGCVYYYQNVGNNVDFELKTLLRGSGDSPANSRFGMSLGRIGDLDSDGYVDLAVGAPFEGEGAVYIFSGSAEGIRQTAVQKITNGATTSEDPNAEPSMFGMSISRGVDIDGNAYNDIAIGAPQAETVQVFKSYPVVKVVASIVPDRKELAQTDNQVRTSVCVHLAANLKNQNVETTLQLEFKLDTQYGRAFFDDRTNIRQFEVLATEEKKCQEFDLFIRPRLEFIFRPIELELHYKNLVVPPSEGPDFCEKCLAMNPNDPTFVTTKLVTMSGCAAEKCVADLRVLSEPLTPISPYILGSTRTISIQYNVENHNELAYLPQMTITKSSQLQFAKIPPNCQTQEETLVCDWRPYLAKDDSRSIIITLETSNMDASTELRVAAQVTSSSEEMNSEDNLVTNVIQVTEFSEIESTGLANPSIVSLDTAGDVVNVTHSIALRNEGPSTIQRMKIIVDIPMFHDVDFDIPMQLLQFNRIVAKARYNNRDLPLSWVQNETILIQNPTEQVLPAIPDDLNAIKFDNYRLGMTDFETPDQQQMEEMRNDQAFRRRRRRDIVETEKTYNIYTQKVTELDVSRRVLKYSFDDAISNRSITFDGHDCDVRHQCIQLELFVSNFKPSRTADINIDVTVEFDLRAVAKLFNERRDSLLYRLGMRVKREGDDSGVTITHHSKLPYTTIVTMIAEVTPLWIYFVSVMCGLLFFTLLTYALYRMGFFRREKREEMAQLARQSKLEADETDDD